MDYVIIKASNAYNIFEYDPAVMADTHLYGPDNNGTPAGVSHVAFCFLSKPTGAKTASATWKRYTDWMIEKTVTPGSMSAVPSSGSTSRTSARIGAKSAAGSPAVRTAKPALGIVQAVSTVPAAK